jgi:hypothetical protein
VIEKAVLHDTARHMVFTRFKSHAHAAGRRFHPRIATIF